MLGRCRVQAKRHDYTVDFRRQLKDVLLSPRGKETVLAMEKQVGAMIEPKADGLSTEASLRKENAALKKEALMKDAQIEALLQQVAQLKRENEAVTLQTADQMIANLSELSGECILSHLSTVPCPPGTPSVKSEGEKTAPYGLEDDDIFSGLPSDIFSDPPKGSWAM